MDLATKHPWKLMLRSAATAGLAALAAIALASHRRPPARPAHLRRRVPRRLSDPDGADHRARARHLQLPPASMLYALDRPDAPLKARLVGTIVYFGIIAPLSWRFGVMGAAAAFVLGYAAMALMLALQVRSEYRRVRTRPA